MTNCPRCREPLAAGQEYCLVCGARTSESTLRVGAGFTSHLTRRLVAAALVALSGAAVAIAATGGDDDGAAIATAIGGFASAPQLTTGELPAGANGVIDWPTGEEGWTIVLASLPQTGGRPAALARARAAQAKRLPQVGVLDSSRYASLHPGYWVVFSGIYTSEAEATSALEDARRQSRTAVVRRVVP